METKVIDIGHLLVKLITTIQEIKENLGKLGNYLVSEDIAYLIEMILHNYLITQFEVAKGRFGRDWSYLER